MIELTDAQLLRTQCLIAGVWVSAHDDKVFLVRNPTTGATLAAVPNMDSAVTKVAITVARDAFQAWRQRTAKERACLLRKWFDLIVEHADDLALIMTAEQGKPLAEAKGEVLYAASFVEWFAEQGKRVAGDVFPSPQADKRIVVLKQPIGVCAAITPWNFPAAMVTRKVAPALAAGCTVVLKPAEQTPLTALALGELANRAGIPAGVLNIVTCDPERIADVGAALTSSADVRKISFTGSTEVGRLLMQQGASTIKKLSLELGGHAPFIVFDDGDLDLAIAGAVTSKFRNAGQTCVCANRFYIQAAIYDQFVEKFTQTVRGLKVGDGMNPDTQIGPLINAAAFIKAESQVADALNKGAQLVTGGKRTYIDSCSGYFFEPTVLIDVTHAMQIAHQETFAPIAPIFKFVHEEEVIHMANQTEYGLAAYVYTQQSQRTWRMMEALEYGIVGVNTGAFSNEVGPFGGVKQSGLGREGSIYGIDEYLEVKYCCIAV
jgi:succinate-semialdehyde dehydrogenase/glutarate-semialdehyde dehydrogenase